MKRFEWHRVVRPIGTMRHPWLLAIIFVIIPLSALTLCAPRWEGEYAAVWQTERGPEVHRARRADDGWQVFEGGGWWGIAGEPDRAWRLEY